MIFFLAGSESIKSSKARTSKDVQNIVKVIIKMRSALVLKFRRF